jgi:hypothetical protein
MGVYSMDKKCVKCDAVLVRCAATSAAVAFMAVKEPVRYFTTKESSELHPYVCTQCGYTEWF